MGLAVSVIEELRRAGQKFEYLPGPWLRVKCPFHDDNTPSCDVCTDGSGGFKCHGCSAHGDFISFMARLLNVERWVIVYDYQKRYGDVNERVLDVGPIEASHQRLWKAQPLLDELYKRAMTDDIIREYRLGEKDGRVQIPVKNGLGAYINSISYAPGAATKKFFAMRGRNDARLYPLDQLNYDKIMLNAGPIKALAAIPALNAAGIGSVCMTLGETSWDNKLNGMFKGKDVAVCNDIDRAGQTGAEERCRAIYPFANKVGNVFLKLDSRDYPKGDLSDFLRLGGDVVEAYKSAKKWAPPRPLTEDLSDPVLLGMVESYMASYATKRVEIKAIISATDEKAYHLPQDVKVNCDRAQNACGMCPIFGLPRDPEPVVAMPKEDKYIMRLMGEGDQIQEATIQDCLGIPECASVKFEVKSYSHVLDLRISPELDLQSRAGSSEDSAFMPAIAVGESRVELNETYKLTGKMLPHPRTQAATMVISKAEPAMDSLSSFNLEEADRERLRAFQPGDNSAASLGARLDDIWEDAEQRVTRIYGRRELHQAIDLAYFSPLFIPNRSERVKGWIEVLIVGDSSQGKSEAAARMMSFYGLGEKVDCKNATTPGLVGGVMQLGSKGRWFVKWGTLVSQDRRLVLLEELKGLSQEVLAKLTDTRSSGVADISKIERRRAHARTRLLANSNPRSRRPVSSYNYGIDTIVELIRNLEDIRRFDFCLVLNKDDVDVPKLQARPHDEAPPEYGRDISRKLVLWAWTRKPEQIHFTTSCEEYLSAAAQELCGMFCDDVPLLDRGSTRHKIGRMAAAIAARTFSTEDGETMVVDRRHAEYARNFVLCHYSSPASGYLDYSNYLKSRGKVLDERQILIQIASSPHSRDLVGHLLNTNDIEHQDICDWCGWERLEATPLISCLVRNNALVRSGRSYYKSAEFVALLQKSLANGALNVPEHLKTKEKF